MNKKWIEFGLLEVFRLIAISDLQRKFLNNKHRSCSIIRSLESPRSSEIAISLNTSSSPNSIHFLFTKPIFPLRFQPTILYLKDYEINKSSIFFLVPCVGMPIIQKYLKVLLNLTYLDRIIRISPKRLAWFLPSWCQLAAFNFCGTMQVKSNDFIPGVKNFVWLLVVKNHRKVLFLLVFFSKPRFNQS